MPKLTKPTTPTDWNDDAQVKAYYDAAHAYNAAESKRKQAEHAKRWTYAGLDAWLTGRNKDSRKLARNTYLMRRPDCIAVKYHQTDVVRYYPDGTITLDSNGWKTMTTKERIDWFTPSWLRVNSDRGVWYVLVRDLKSDSYWGGTRYRFFDGITFGPRGGCRNPMPQSKADRETEANRKVDDEIRVYVAGWLESAVTGQMPLPSESDCWFCCMFPETKGSEGDHLQAHIEEQYYVPSLVVKAARAKQHGDPIFAVQMIYGLRAAEDGEHFDGTRVAVKETRKLLTWYMRKHLRVNMAPPRMG